MIEDNRLKHAASLSPTRLIQDMSRQDAQSLPINGIFSKSSNTAISSQQN